MGGARGFFLPGKRIYQQRRPATALISQESEQAWSSASRSHVGKIRKINEDALLDRPEAGLWVVADGMGGHSAGDFASTTIVTTLGDITPVASLDGFAEVVTQSLRTVNQTLRDEAARRDHGTIGSTVVALLARDSHYRCLWSGDSRIYLLRAGQLRQLTHDHSLVDQWVQQGIITPEQAQHHPSANIITRAVGADPTLDLDSVNGELLPGDVFLLCSDGLTKELDEHTIAWVMQQHDLELACQQLLDQTLEHGARDNVSLVLVKVANPQPAN